LGTIEAGKLADLTVVEGTNYFNPDAKVRAVWIDGRIYPSPPEESKPGESGGIGEDRAGCFDGTRAGCSAEGRTRKISHAPVRRPARTETGDRD